MEYLQSYGKINVISKGMRGYPGTLNSTKLLPTLALKVQWIAIFTLKYILGTLPNVSMYITVLS